MRISGAAEPSCAIPFAPSPGRTLYFGLNYYYNAIETKNASFMIDISSVKTAVVTSALGAGG